MKTAVLWACSVLVAFAASGCREEERLTILFGGDERGWVLPAG